MTPLDKPWTPPTSTTKQDDLTEDSPKNSVELDDEADNQTDIYTSEDEPQENQNDSASCKMDELRIMLLGRRRVGKSSTGNTILSQQAFAVNKTLGRVTQVCDRREGIVDGRPVVVIDTPGLKDSTGDEKKIRREILKSMSFYKPGPHIFLVILPIGNLTQDDNQVLKIIQKMFGENVWQYTILVFTYGDTLDGKTLNAVISTAERELREVIRKCSGGFVVFSNKDMGNPTQVFSLMEKIDTLMAINGKSSYLNKYYPLFERKIRQRHEKHMEEKSEEIAEKLKEVEELYSGIELEEKKGELWRKTDEELRSLAENPLKSKISKMKTQNPNKAKPLKKKNSPSTQDLATA